MVNLQRQFPCPKPVTVTIVSLKAVQTTHCQAAFQRWHVCSSGTCCTMCGCAWVVGAMLHSHRTVLHLQLHHHDYAGVGQASLSWPQGAGGAGRYLWVVIRPLVRHGDLGIEHSFCIKPITGFSPGTIYNASQCETETWDITVYNPCQCYLSFLVSSYVQLITVKVTPSAVPAGGQPRCPGALCSARWGAAREASAGAATGGCGPGGDQWWTKTGWIYGDLSMKKLDWTIGW